MFTHKQAWRRQKRTRSFDRNLYYDAMQLEDSLKRSPSLPTIGSRRMSLKDTRKHHTTGDLEEDGRVRAVKFNDCSKVVLIPSREEYIKHGLSHDIWWEPDDYTYFKASARLEVMDLLEKFGGNIQNVLNALYQPDSRNINFLHRTASTEDDDASTSSSASSTCSFASDFEEPSSNDHEVKVDSNNLVHTQSEESGQEASETVLRKCDSGESGQSIVSAELRIEIPKEIVVRVPRDSLRKRDHSPTPFSTSKQVHPLALMV